jgi:hypothetical protein
MYYNISMDYWKTPHINKVYEALTALSSGRMTFDGDTARCGDSKGTKFYDIVYDPLTGAINSNDNSAYYMNELSYPMIAYLMQAGFITYNKCASDQLKCVIWKDYNTKTKNNWTKSVDLVLADLGAKGIDINSLKSSVEDTYNVICNNRYPKLGKTNLPPK